MPRDLPRAGRASGRPLLTAAQERELARSAARGDAAAKRRLVEANLGLVASIAAQYRRRGVPFADLVQEGSIGLIRAAERFDPDRAVRFSTYATWWIRHAVVRAIGDASAIRLPSSARRRLGALRSAGAELTAATGREPTLEEAAHAAGLAPADAVRLERAARVCSLDEPAHDGAQTRGEALTADDERAGDADQDPIDRDRLWRAIAALPAPQRQVIERCYGLDGTRAEDLADIAAQLGVSAERARQLRAAALLRLRAAALGPAPARPMAA